MRSLGMPATRTGVADRSHTPKLGVLGGNDEVEPQDVRHPHSDCGLEHLVHARGSPIPARKGRLRGVACVGLWLLGGQTTRSNGRSCFVVIRPTVPRGPSSRGAGHTYSPRPECGWKGDSAKEVCPLTTRCSGPASPATEPERYRAGKSSAYLTGRESPSGKGESPSRIESCVCGGGARRTRQAKRRQRIL
jgi:hypothetical protein